MPASRMPGCTSRRWSGAGRPSSQPCTCAEAGQGWPCRRWARSTPTWTAKRSVTEMTNVLAIDQGTSGTKAIVADDAGQVLAIAEQPLYPLYFDGGGGEQDPGALLDSVLTAGRRAVAEAGVPLDAVALANQGETVLAWDRATGR